MSDNRNASDKEIPWYGLTHVGKVRRHNEDYYIAVPELGLWVVADGMGGYSAGDVASRLAVESVVEAVRSGADLISAVKRAHLKILEYLTESPDVEKMGSTIVALKIDGNRYQIAWVGDSRAYKWDGNSLIRLTKDHSFVQQLVDSGTISESQARYHPQRNIITRALGVGEEVDVDYVEGDFSHEESFLICTDGLTGEVDDREITSLLGQGKGPEEICHELIKLALDRGGSDNITVVIVGNPVEAEKEEPMVTERIRVVEDDLGTEWASSRNDRVKFFKIGALAAVGLVILIALFVLVRKPKTLPVGGGAGGSGVPVEIALNKNEITKGEAKRSGNSELKSLNSSSKGLGSVLNKPKATIINASKAIVNNRNVSGTSSVTSTKEGSNNNYSEENKPNNSETGNSGKIALLTSQKEECLKLGDTIKSLDLFGEDEDVLNEVKSAWQKLKNCIISGEIPKNKFRVAYKLLYDKCKEVRDSATDKVGSACKEISFQMLQFNLHNNLGFLEGKEEGGKGSE